MKWEITEEVSSFRRVWSRSECSYASWLVQLSEGFSSERLVKVKSAER